MIGTLVVPLVLIFIMFVAFWLLGLFFATVIFLFCHHIRLVDFVGLPSIWQCLSSLKKTTTPLQSYYKIQAFYEGKYEISCGQLGRVQNLLYTTLTVLALTAGGAISSKNNVLWFFVEANQHLYLSMGFQHFLKNTLRQI